MAVYLLGDAVVDRALCSGSRSADEEGEMVLADLQTLQFEVLLAEDKCLVELHAALPLTPRSTEETVTIDKWLCCTQLVLLIDIAGEPVFREQVTSPSTKVTKSTCPSWAHAATLLHA